MQHSNPVYPQQTAPTAPPPPAQPVVVQGQPVAIPYQQPVGYQHPPTAQGQPAQLHPPDENKTPHTLILISHSSLFYWWPVWVVGFVMAAVTYWSGEQYQIGQDLEYYYPNSNAGILFFLTLSLVLLITNVQARGLASVIVILAGVLAAFVLAYYGAWDAIFGWFGDLKIHLNLGAYFWFSTLLFIVWALAFFVFDRFEYWRVEPGQVTREFAWGAGSKTYDTENMVLEKHRDDIFRHWILGLGSGDLHLRPHGANRDEIEIPNVLFVGSKIRRMQDLIATQPERRSN